MASSFTRLLLAVLIPATLFLTARLDAAARYLRVNQVGYLSTDTKVAIAFSNDNLSGLSFSVLRSSDSAVLFGPTVLPASSGAYNPFANVYKLDFSAFQPAAPVTCKLQLSDGTLSPDFLISSCTYSSSQELILNFYLGQRCGADNKYAGAVCHMAPGGASSRMDGKVVGGPYNNLLMDSSGGWHDSGDYIKFMITTGWSCENLLLAYRENPSAFADNLDAHGVPGPNGIPDVLDEAKYALDWIMKMNPDANTLYYQVGGAEDHNLGLGTMPQNDNAAYATAPYRPVYYGNGSNNCGKAATSLAMAYQIWNARGDTAYASTCLSYATRIYALGKATAKSQAANPAAFYTESDWRDDMEWAASEMYRATGTASYLTDAKAWAAAVGASGGQLDWDACNFLAHYSLYPQVDAATKASLQGYMNSDLSSNLATANGNPYGMCTPYSWGSMEVLTGGIVKAQLYKKLFGVTTYDSMATWSRDYMLGKNPWGVSFIVGMGTTYPRHPQHNITVGKNIDIPGMPIEGPDALSDWSSQGITLGGPDIYAAFQSTAATGGVYHDDIQDFATNECTTTHAGLAVLMFANLSSSCSLASPTSTPNAAPPTFTPTRTPSPTVTSTPTFSQSRTWSPTSSPTATHTTTATPTRTATQSNSPTFARSPTQTSSVTPVNSPTSSATQTLAASSTSSQTSTPVVTPSSTRTSSPAATLTSSPMATMSPTQAGSQTSTQAPSQTFTQAATLTRTPAASATHSPQASQTPSPLPTQSASPSRTRTASPSPTATGTLTQSPTVTATPTCSPQASGTHTYTQTSTASPTPSPTLTCTVASSPVPTSGRGELERLEEAVIWPNPLHGRLGAVAFKLKGSTEVVHVRLYSEGMSCFWQTELNGNFRDGWNNATLNLPEIPNGCFYLRVDAGDGKSQATTARVKACKYD